MTKIKTQLTVLICRTVMVAIVKLFLWTTQTGCSSQLSSNIGDRKYKNRQGWSLFSKKHQGIELQKIAENVTNISDNNTVFVPVDGKLYKVTLRTKKDANNYYTTNSDTYSIFLSENSGELHSTSSRVTTDESLNNASCKEMKVEYVEANTLLNISEEQPCQEPLFNSQDQQKNINKLDELANSLKEL